MNLLKNPRSFLMVLLLLTCQMGQSQNRNPEHPQQKNFREMSDYLSRGSGKWKAKNPQYNANNPRSSMAFGLWFERPLYHLLAIKIVAYKADTTFVSSQGIFSWHPDKKQYIHVTSDRGGGFSEGVTEFVNDSTFISTMRVYRGNGQIYDHKDENFIVDDNTHRNISYKKDEEGKWVENGSWLWKRVPRQ